MTTAHNHLERRAGVAWWRRLAAAGATAAVTAAVTLASPPAPASASPGSGALSSAGTALYLGCNSHAYSWSITMPDGVDGDPYDPGAVDDWTLAVRVLGPTGVPVGQYADYGNGTGGWGPPKVVTGSDAVLLCHNLHAAGRYTVEGAVTYWDMEGHKRTFTLASTAFDVRAAATATDARATKRKTRKGVVVRVKAQVTDERATGYVGTPASPVALQRLRNGKWRTLAVGATDAAGVARFKYTYPGGKVRLRVATPATASHLGSTSPTLKVR